MCCFPSASLDRTDALSGIVHALLVYSGTALLKPVQQIDEQTLHAGEAAENIQPETVIYIPLWHGAIVHLLHSVDATTSGNIKLKRVIGALLIPDIL